MSNIIIWGATGHAIVLEELISHTPDKIVVFFENNINVPSPEKNIPIFYGEEGFRLWCSNIENIFDYYFLVAIGGNNGTARSTIGAMLEKAGVKPYTAIHHKSFVASNAVIGKGAQIMANSSVCAKAAIGDFCIINTSANVDHECILENNVHIAPGAVLTGCVHVGKNSFIGAGTVVLPRLKIGANVAIGAGSIVTKNIPDNCVAYGNPCKIIKQ